MSGLWLLVVKGNLRHRIEKLGVEKADSDLTEDQRKLREYAQLQVQGFGSEKGACQEHPERPPWANGAFVYLTPEHAADIFQAVDESALVLQSKHVLVSDEYRDLVKRVLATGPQGSGREAFLLRRAGAVEREEEVQARRYAETSIGEGISQASWESRQTRTTGERPRDLLACDEEAELSGEERLPGRADYGPHRKHVRLLQLDRRLLERRDVDLELAEYLTAPASVQELDPDMWTRAWNQVCEENDWIEMRDHEKCGPCPHCTLCCKWAEVGHLMGKNCRSKQAKRGKEVGPLLEAILKAEEERRLARVVRSPTAEAPEVPAAVEEHGKRLPTPPPPPPKGRCPRPGCPHMTGGRGSATHCCKRCEFSHKAGRRLDRDPRTGQPWAQDHGPECTSKLTREAYHRMPPPPPPADSSLAPRPFPPGAGWRGGADDWRGADDWHRAGDWRAAGDWHSGASDSAGAALQDRHSGCCWHFLRLFISLKVRGWGTRTASRVASDTTSSTDNLELGTCYATYEVQRRARLAAREAARAAPCELRSTAG